MIDYNDVRRRLQNCPPGWTGWRQFEDACTDALRLLFVPPLTTPIIQPRTYSGTDRRDAVFPNRNFDTESIWGQFRHELDARLILFEFKNYDASDLTKDEVLQTADYLTEPMGRLAFICCTKEPEKSARIKRNSIFASQAKKVILFLTRDQILEMLGVRESGDDPSFLLMDLLELFYLQHE